MLRSTRLINNGGSGASALPSHGAGGGGASSSWRQWRGSGLLSGRGASAAARLGLVLRSRLAWAAVAAAGGAAAGGSHHHGEDASSSWPQLPKRKKQAADGGDAANNDAATPPQPKPSDPFAFGSPIRRCTDAILVLTAACFALQWLTRDAITVWGAKVNGLVWPGGQLWRLFTPALLHSGLLHLAINSHALFTVGPHLEAVAGGPRLCATYVVSAVTGTALSVLMTPAPSVGASGEWRGSAEGAAASAVFLRMSAVDIRPLQLAHSQKPTSYPHHQHTTHKNQQKQRPSLAWGPPWPFFTSATASNWGSSAPTAS